MAVAPQSLANLRPWTADDRARRVGGHANHPRIRLSQYIRAQTHEGEELVDFMVRVMRGEHVEGLGRKPRMRERLLAIEWLADRAYGKPREHINLEDGSSLGTREQRLLLIAAMPDEDRALLKTIFTLVAQQQQGESADSTSDSTSAAPDARP
jgi:hypothetical protein